MIICPTHKKEMIPSKTRYGNRYFCPETGCDMVGWNDNPPATEVTRQARIKAHDMFDNIWKSGSMTRAGAYRKLSEFMGLKPEKTHIGLFDLEQCLIVIDFAETVFQPL